MPKNLCFLVDKYTPDRRFYSMGEAVKEGAHAFLQKGEAMRMQKCEHPSATMDLSKMWHPGSGRQLRSDAKGTTAGASRTRLGEGIRKPNLLARRQLQDTWRRHQSIKASSGDALIAA